jgi:hypothetical protein
VPVAISYQPPPFRAETRQNRFLVSTQALLEKKNVWVGAAAVAMEAVVWVPEAIIQYTPLKSRQYVRWVVEG